MSNIDKQALRETNSNPVKRIDIGIDEYTWLPIEKACPEGKYVLHSDYLALLDDLEAAEHTAAVDHEAACSLVEENEEVKRKLTAAEKRIAELEARTLSQAATDVLAEHRRQITAEGWTPEHDDKYRHSEMLWAACCYVLNTIQKYNRVPFDWPWRDEWWKPTNQRRDLVKANALLLAEIERIDRAAGIGEGE